MCRHTTLGGPAFFDSANGLLENLADNAAAMVYAERLYIELAAAYVRGKLPEAASDLNDQELLELGWAAGLNLHRFKRTIELPRVRAVLGVLHGIAPCTLLDIGSGRGVFLWPLLDTFPELLVTAVELDAQRRAHLEAVQRGGISSACGEQAWRIDVGLSRAYGGKPEVLEIAGDKVRAIAEK